MRPKGQSVEKLPIHYEQYVKLLRATKHSKELRTESKKKLSIAFTLLYNTGCRIDEIRELHVGDIKNMIELKMFVIYAGKTKTNKGRTVRLSDHSIADISNAYSLVSDKKENDFIFNSRKGDCMGQAVFQRMVNSQIHTVLGPAYSSHSFRYGVASRIVRTAGVSIAQKHLGHSSAQTTTIYDRPQENEVIDALNKSYERRTI